MEALKNTIKTLMLIFFLAGSLAGAQSAFAQAPGAEDATGYIKEIIGKPYTETEIAHRSLAQLFGGFIFEPFGDAPTEKYPPTALASVLGYTNVVALILGIIIMSYVIVAGALNTAASGEMLGKSWSSVWLPLRTSVAFGMVMPASGTTGETFSVAQSLVIYLVIIGSNSGTWVWEKGVDLLITGSPVSATHVAYNANEYTQYASLIHCAAVVNKIKTDRDKKPPVSVTYWRIGTPAEILVTGAYFGNRERITFEEFKANYTTYVTSGIQLGFDACGSMKIPSHRRSLTRAEEEGALLSPTANWESNMEKSFIASYKKNFPAVIESALDYADYMVINNLNSIKISEAMEQTDPAVALLINEATGKLKNIDTTYDNFIQTVTKETVPENVEKEWKSLAKEGGWMAAGAWFFQASKLQGYLQSLVGGLHGLAAPDVSNRLSMFCIRSACEKRDEMYRQLISGNDEIAIHADRMSSSEHASFDGSSSTQKASLTQKTENGEALRKDATRTVSVLVTQVFLDSLMWLGSDNTGTTGGSTGSITSSNVSGMISPFTAISSIGRGLQQVSVLTWSAGLIAAGFIGIEGSLAGQVAGAFIGGAASFGTGMIKYVMATLIPVMAGVSSLGFVLAFAIPFMPITIWIMLVCGYLVMAVEAVAAAPLAVIMLATPEGEGISGHNFQKALQMINAIILRPTLSIVGLFAAMTLAYIGFSIMNTLFWQVANSLTGGSIFEVIAMIIIYTSVAYKLCEYMVGVIHKIPDQIMEWMGGGLSRSFGEDAAEKGASTGLEKGVAGGGMAIGAGVGSLGSTAVAGRKAAAEKADKAAAAKAEG